MSFTEVLDELPTLTVEQRQIVLSRVLELDALPLDPEAEALVESRLAAHRSGPSTSLPLADLKARLGK
ncbi:MAG TPA: hypothetical protein VIM58_12010 [Candidatus Methylacidiphilales bacterium]